MGLNVVSFVGFCVRFFMGISASLSVESFVGCNNGEDVGVEVVVINGGVGPVT